jgi:hypothetical protein
VRVQGNWKVSPSANLVLKLFFSSWVGRIVPDQEPWGIMSCHSQDGCEACHSVSPTLLKRLQWATVNVDSALSGSVSAGNSRTFFT